MTLKQVEHVKKLLDQRNEYKRIVKDLADAESVKLYVDSDKELMEIIRGYYKAKIAEIDKEIRKL